MRLIVIIVDKGCILGSEVEFKGVLSITNPRVIKRLKLVYFNGLVLTTTRKVLLLVSIIGVSINLEAIKLLGSVLIILRL